MVGSKSETIDREDTKPAGLSDLATPTPVKEEPKRPSVRKAVPADVKEAAPVISTDSSVPNAHTAFVKDRPSEMPQVPSGFFWRVKVYEDEHYGTSFQVELRQRLFIGSKKIDSIVTSANKYSAYFQGTSLDDRQTLASLAEAIWNSGSNRASSISRQTSYSQRAKDMKRFAHDYDPQHRLSEIIK